MTGAVVVLLAAASVVAWRVVAAAVDRPVPLSDPLPESLPAVLPPTFVPETASPSKSGVPPNPAVAAITAYTACSTRTAVTFTATYPTAHAYRHVFIDADGDATTGYRTPEFRGGLGAEYMIENDLLYRSTGSDWSWAQVKGVTPLLSHTGSGYRWRLGPRYGGVRVVFNGSAGDTGDVYSPIVLVKAC